MTHLPPPDSLYRPEWLLTKEPFYLITYPQLLLLYPKTLLYHHKSLHRLGISALKLKTYPYEELRLNSEFIAYGLLDPPLYLTIH